MDQMRNHGQFASTTSSRVKMRGASAMTLINAVLYHLPIILGRVVNVITCEQDSSPCDIIRRLSLAPGCLAGNCDYRRTQGAAIRLSFHWSARHPRRTGPSMQETPIERTVAFKFRSSSGRRSSR